MGLWPQLAHLLVRDLLARLGHGGAQTPDLLVEITKPRVPIRVLGALDGLYLGLQRIPEFS